MTNVTELDPGQNASVDADITDRRRPGRLKSVSPELIPMLRGQNADVVIDFEDVDQTAAIRGLFFGVLLSAPIWVGIAYVGSLILSR